MDDWTPFFNLLPRNAFEMFLTFCPVFEILELQLCETMQWWGESRDSSHELLARDKANVCQILLRQLLPSLTLMQNHQLSWFQLPRTRRGKFFAAWLQGIKVFLVASLDTQWLAGFLDTSLEGVTVVYTVQNSFSFKSPDSILSPKISLIMAVFAAQVEPACKTYTIQAYLLPSKVPQLNIARIANAVQCHN